MSERLSMTRAVAIRQFCLECMGFYKSEIDRCPDRACPLWEFRRGPVGKEEVDVPLRYQESRPNRPMGAHPPSGGSG